MNDSAVVLATAAWTNATANDTAISVDVDGFDAATLSFSPTGSITGGTLNFEVSDDGGTTWFSTFATRFGSKTSEGTFVLSGATKQIWQINCTSMTQCRVRLNPVITGAGTAALRLQSAETSVDPGSVTDSSTATPVSIASLPLPTGASTEATLALIKAKTDNLDVALSTRAVTGLTDAQLRASAVPVSAASLPLPAGAATEATLATRAADATITARLGVLGQAVMASSAPVVIASNQTAVPVSAASLPLPTGAATSANQATEITSLANLDVLLSTRLKPADTLAAVTSITNPVTVIGNKTNNNAAPGATNVGALVAVATAAAPSLTEGNQVGLSTDLTGALRVASSAGGTSSNFGSAFPTPGTAAGFSDGTNMQGARVFDVDSGGGTQYVAGVNLRQSASGGSVEVGTQANPLSVSPPTDVTVFGDDVVAGRITQVTANFIDTIAKNNLTSTVTSTGTNTQASGQATLATSTGTSATAKLVTLGTVRYAPNREVYCAITAVWVTPPTGASDFSRIGVYDTNEGFWIGYKGTGFGIASRTATVDTFVARASWNGDLLTGAAGSKFTRAGVVEAIDLTKQNLFRIRFGWLGSAQIIYEVESPDGKWVVFHTIRQPNLSATPSILTPNLPVTAEVGKVASDATNVTLKTSCWDLGIVANLIAQQNTNLDNGNSSTATLTATSVFTGSAIETFGYGVIISTAFSDVAGTLVIQESSDGTNWDRTTTSELEAGFSATVRVSPSLRFARVVYTNGATNQSSFRLQTFERPIDAGISDTADTDPPIGANGLITRSFDLGRSVGSFHPAPDFFHKNLSLDDTSTNAIDAQGSLFTRGPSYSDEGGFYDEFPGASLNTTLTGTALFTNGSMKVVGVGSLFLTEINHQVWIKISSHAETAWGRVVQIDSNTVCWLEANYTGATTTAAYQKTFWPTVTGSGASVSVASSAVTLVSGTTNGAKMDIYREIDFSPVMFRFRASVSQRIANQEMVIGLVDNTTTITQQASVVFSGTTNTTVILRTWASSAAADQQETTVTLPAGATTATSNEYIIAIGAIGVTFTINGAIALVQSHKIPNPYSILNALLRTNNTGAAAGSTNVVVDTVYVRNVDQTEVTSSFPGDSMPIKLLASSKSQFAEASINFSATGDNTIVALTASQTIRVHRIFIVANSQTDIIFKDATAGNALTGAMTMSKGGGMTFDFSGEPWFTTASGGAFVINQSGVAQISGRVYYTKS